MIYGIGVDLAEVSRFEKWVKNPIMIERFFHESEISEIKMPLTQRRISALCQHYAVRFAAKEAFSKALGTGITGFDLKDVFVNKDSSGKPFICVKNNAKKILTEKCGDCKVHLSLSHEKEYAVAYVIIEIA